ncbi:MAG TPA: DUF4255 domain-containing protein [Hydrogenispora sp.]|nr:DUF4255 domain-containing protein [Hydrogenispora sp.]
MIDKVMEVIRAEVNDFIGRKLEDTTIPDRVVLTSFVDDNGRVAIPTDAIGLSLLNIEEERTFKEAAMIRTAKAESSSSFVTPPISLNLQIMFTAYFKNYAESLKQLSFILGCLQTKPVFDRNNTPALVGLDTAKLIFELNTLPLEQQHYIWSMIGLRYLPSVIYRVRMLTIFERDVISEVANIKEITTVSNLKEVRD